ncbi:ufm1-specific protease 1 [Stigmatopora argus]
MAINWGGYSSENSPFTATIIPLLTNAHRGLPPPVTDPLQMTLVNGDYQYYHYGCDGQDDRGWGCGYRTLQTMASWLIHNVEGVPKRPPPSIPETQQALVTMMDKPYSFLGSKDWIGTFEASLVLSYFYNVPSKLVHIRSGGTELDLVAVEELHQHFAKNSCPAMMGGDRDNSSKGVLGVCTGTDGSYLLIVDPHYHGCPLGREETQKRRWIEWKRLSHFNQSSFYNLCLPQTDAKTHMG